jgi:hypothetical protein
MAAAIIAYREAAANPPAFRCAADLDGVSRIGPVTVELLRPYWVFPAEGGQRDGAAGQPAPMLNEAGAADGGSADEALVEEDAP